MKSRIKKVCEGYHASIYPCPELLEERREMLVGVETRLEDLDRILKETNDHRQSFLQGGYKSKPPPYSLRIRAFFEFSCNV